MQAWSWLEVASVEGRVVVSIAAADREHTIPGTASLGPRVLEPRAGHAGPTCDTRIRSGHGWPGSRFQHGRLDTLPPGLPVRLLRMATSGRAGGTGMAVEQTAGLAVEHPAPVARGKHTPAAQTSRDCAASWGHRARLCAARRAPSDIVCTRPKSGAEPQTRLRRRRRHAASSPTSPGPGHAAQAGAGYAGGRRIAGGRQHSRRRPRASCARHL